MQNELVETRRAKKDQHETQENPRRVPVVPKRYLETVCSTTCVSPMSPLSLAFSGSYASISP